MHNLTHRWNLRSPSHRLRVELLRTVGLSFRQTGDLVELCGTVTTTVTDSTVLVPLP